jgi:hypothetical protein
LNGTENGKLNCTKGGGVGSPSPRHMTGREEILYCVTARAYHLLAERSIDTIRSHHIRFDPNRLQGLDSIHSTSGLSHVTETLTQTSSTTATRANDS